MKKLGDMTGLVQHTARWRPEDGPFASDLDLALTLSIPLTRLHRWAKRDSHNTSAALPLNVRKVGLTDQLVYLQDAFVERVVQLNPDIDPEFAKTTFRLACRRTAVRDTKVGQMARKALRAEGAA